MANAIWVVIQHREGRIQKMSLEAVRAAQELAAAIGAEAFAVLMGSDLDEMASQLGQIDLAGVLVADNSKLDPYTPGGYTSVLRPVISEASPAFVIFPHTYQTVDYAPRLAQELDAAMISETTAFEFTNNDVVWSRPILGGKLEARVKAKGNQSALVSVQSGSFSADSVEKGSAPVEKLQFDTESIHLDRELLGVEAAVSEQVDLTQSDIIVAIGRGLGDPENIGIIEELAKALGAEIGASRPVIDSGWLPRERQIGSSGQTVAPKLYLAAGISGAIQHLVGMKGAQTIVAINKDPGAPIFNIADYGIVGDLHEVIPALTAAVNEVKAD